MGEREQLTQCHACRFQLISQCINFCPFINDAGGAYTLTIGCMLELLLLIAHLLALMAAVGGKGDITTSTTTTAWAGCVIALSPSG
jgi:hypothetical protein